jgi:hypothetical protein
MSTLELIPILKTDRLQHIKTKLFTIIGTANIIHT